MDKLLRFLGWTIVVVGILGGLTRALLLDGWVIPDEGTRFGISMEPTLTAGDTVLMLSFGTPGFGDLVRCTDPDDANGFVVGRIAGLSGDVVEVSGRDLTVNNKRYHSEVVCPMPTVTVIHPTSKQEITIHCDEIDMGGRMHFRGYGGKADIFTPTKANVGTGNVFLLSDDRSYHDDSRDFGMVPLATCKNRILFRLWGKDGWKDDKRRLTYIR
jgi:signal peptidase I